MSDAIGLRHVILCSATESQNIFNVGRIRFVVPLDAGCELLFRYYRTSCRRAKYLTEMPREGRPIGEVALVVVIPGFSDAIEVKRNVAQFVRLVPIITNAGSIITVQPFFDVFVAKAGKYRRVSMRGTHGVVKPKWLRRSGCSSGRVGFCHRCCLRAQPSTRPELQG